VPTQPVQIFRNPIDRDATFASRWLDHHVILIFLLLYLAFKLLRGLCRVPDSSRPHSRFRLGYRTLDGLTLVPNDPGTGVLGFFYDSRVHGSCWRVVDVVVGGRHHWLLNSGSLRPYEDLLARWKVSWPHSVGKSTSVLLTNHRTLVHQERGAGRVVDVQVGGWGLVDGSCVVGVMVSVSSDPLLLKGLNGGVHARISMRSLRLLSSQNSCGLGPTGSCLANWRLVYFVRVFAELLLSPHRPSLFERLAHSHVARICTCTWPCPWWTLVKRCLHVVVDPAGCFMLLVLFLHMLEALVAIPDSFHHPWPKKATRRRAACVGVRQVPAVVGIRVSAGVGVGPVVDHLRDRRVAALLQVRGHFINHMICLANWRLVYFVI
jgi:hypothetical protein